MLSPPRCAYLPFYGHALLVGVANRLSCNLTLLVAHYIVLREKVQQTDLICGNKLKDRKTQAV